MNYFLIAKNIIAKQRNLLGLIKNLLPPIITQKLKDHLNNSIEYQSYDAAIKNSDNYDNDDLAKVLVSKGEMLSAEIIEKKEVSSLAYQTFVGLACAVNSKKLKVIDFGGSTGTHYYWAKAILQKNIEIDWRIVETKSIVKNAKERGLETSELSFHETIEAASKMEDFDLVFASGSLQYTPEPFDFLKKLIEVNSKKIVLSRLPVSERKVVLLQKTTFLGNAVGNVSEIQTKNRVISYPVTMLEKGKLEKLLSDSGDIQFKLLESKASYQSKKGDYDMWTYVVDKEPQ